MSEPRRVGPFPWASALRHRAAPLPWASVPRRAAPRRAAAQVQLAAPAAAQVQLAAAAQVRLAAAAQVKLVAVAPVQLASAAQAQRTATANPVFVDDVTAAEKRVALSARYDDNLTPVCKFSLWPKQVKQVCCSCRHASIATTVDVHGYTTTLHNTVPQTSTTFHNTVPQTSVVTLACLLVC